MAVPVRFSIFDGDQIVRTEVLSQDVIKVGKLDSSHLRIDDDAVSRMHSVIEVGPAGEVFVIDLGSAAGTVVNGQKVSKARLQTGDQLMFGRTRVMIEIGEEQAAVQPNMGGPTMAGYGAGMGQSMGQQMGQPGMQADAGYQQPMQPMQTGGYGGAQQHPGFAGGAEHHAGQHFAQEGYGAQGYGAQEYAGQEYAAQDYGAHYDQGGQAYHDGYGANGHGGHGDEDPDRVTYQMVPVAPPINPADVESGDTAVEVVVMWGDNSILHVEHLSPPRGFTVGDGLDKKGVPTSDFLIGSESLGAETLPITVESGAGVAVVIPHGADGDVTLQDQYFTFADLAAQGRLQASSALPGAQQYSLPPGATARVMYRGFTFVVRPVNAGRPVGIGGPQVDWKSYTWTFVSMAFHIGLLLLFYFLPPSSSSLSLDLLTADDRFAKYLIEPDELVEEETPDWLEDSPQEDDEGGKGKRHKDEEGQMGKKDEKKTKNKFGIEGPADNENPVMAREEAKEMAANAGIIGILKASVGSFNSPTSPYGADSALGSDPMSAMGALMGDQIGSNFGFGGLGLRGTGRGGGGTGEGTIGLGNIGTIGHGAGGGTGSGYGSGAGGFRGRSSKVPRIRTGKADVRGSLSKEVIRRIIRRHINEVRFCYEQELNSRPDLQGRVAVKFIVSPTGAVQTAAVANSTMGNAKVEQCIVKSVRRWTFPAPDGGGIVVVTYPFVLQQTGG